MGWYQVVKTINGRRYLYWQKTYRVGGSVKTLNKYIGPANNPPRMRALKAQMENLPQAHKELRAQFDAGKITKTQYLEAIPGVSLSLHPTPIYAFGDNDKVQITDKATRRTAIRFVYNSPRNGLVLKDPASGIPCKVDRNKFNITLLEKNSPDAPKPGPSINSPEMVALENASRSDDELSDFAREIGLHRGRYFCKKCEKQTHQVDFSGYCRSCSLAVDSRYFK